MAMRHGNMTPQLEFRQKNRKTREDVLAVLLMAGRPLSVSKIHGYVHSTSHARVKAAVFGLMRLGLARWRKKGCSMIVWAKRWH